MKQLNLRQIQTCTVIVLMILAAGVSVLSAEPPIIPGAVGFGMDTRAAYGDDTDPTICIVNTLNARTGITDSTRNGIPVKVGGLDPFLEWRQDNKVIIFEVSGYITVNDAVYIQENNITIAGQTAPSPGVTFRNYSMVISGDDILVQHIRVRMDDCPEGPNYNSRDGINVTNYGTTEYASNVVVDHCSVSWGMDENMGVGDEFDANITISNCIIAEGLSYSHHEKVEHSKGMIIGGGQNIAILNNLFAHNRDRNPCINPPEIKILIANNLVYNPGSLNTYISERSVDSSMDFVGNVIIGGPNSGGYAQSRFPSLVFFQNPDNLPNLDISFYIANTRLEQIGQSVFTQTSPNDWSRVRLASGSDDETECKSINPTFPHPAGFTPISSSVTESYVLAKAGARPADRDSADTRIVNDVINGTGSIIDSPSDVGWPVLAENQIVHTLPNNPHGDSDGDGYTNLEEWLHSLSAQVEGNVGANTPPNVNAGSDQVLTLPADAVLDGSVIDDNKPNPPATVTTTWTKQSGPAGGIVTYGNENAIDTTASFSEFGIYVLRLTADDSELQAYDDVTITVNPIPVTKTYTAFQISSPPTIDGNIEEFINANTINLTGTDVNGTYRILYDSTALYIAAEVNDPELNAINTDRDGALYQDDSIELFFDTLNNAGTSMGADDYKFYVNLHNAQRDSSGSSGASWNITFSSSLDLVGTLNNNGDTDTSYTIEIAIPWSNWGISTPAADDIYGFDLSLNDRDAAGSGEKSIWSNSDSGSSNNPDGWGELVFSSTVVDGGDTEAPDKPTGLMIIE